MKKILFIIIIILLVTGGAYKLVHKDSSPFELEKVKKGEITQLVSVTGEVKTEKEINLNFRTPGVIKEVYVKEGDTVKEGDILASLDTRDLEIQLEGAKSNLEAAEANYQKILKGVESEKLEMARLEYENAKIGVESARKNLQASEEKIPIVLSSAFNNAQSAYNLIEAIYKLHFKFYTNYVWSDRYSDALLVKKERDEAKSLVAEIKSFQDNPTKESLLQCAQDLYQVGNYLRTLEEISSKDKYFNEFTDTERSNLYTIESQVNLSESNVRELSATLESLELSLEIAERKEEIAQKNLSLLERTPKKEDIDFYKSQVEVAKSQISLLEEKIEEATLKAPISGKVLEINFKKGEYISSFNSTPFIKLVSGKSLYVEANVPESDIGKVNLGNECIISLNAFPEENFSGKVLEIGVSPKLVGGTVYYKVKTSIEGKKELLEKIKTGMTADLDIVTSKKEDVIVIPQRAIFHKGSKKFVRVFQEGKVIEKEIQTGISNSEGDIEVISGLKEGEMLIVSEKK